MEDFIFDKIVTYSFITFNLAGYLGYMAKEKIFLGRMKKNFLMHCHNAFYEFGIQTM